MRKAASTACCMSLLRWSHGGKQASWQTQVVITHLCPAAQAGTGSVCTAGGVRGCKQTHPSNDCHSFFMFNSPGECQQSDSAGSKTVLSLALNRPTALALHSASMLSLRGRRPGITCTVQQQVLSAEGWGSSRTHGCIQLMHAHCRTRLAAWPMSWLAAMDMQDTSTDGKTSCWYSCM